jgi:predicted acetyltransferase
MKVRQATLNDLEQLVDLNRLCYPTLGMTVEQVQGIFIANTRCTWDDVFVADEGGRILSGLIAYKFKQWIEDIAIETIGIGDVVVSPDVRRQGVAGELIKHVMKQFSEEEYPASILYPFQHQFYRHLGWGYAGELRHYHYLTEQLGGYLDAHEEEDISIRRLLPDDQKRLMAFYDAEARRSNGLLKRTPEYWTDRLLRLPRSAILALSSGDIIGYLIYSVTRFQTGNRLLQELDVHEWLAPTMDAKSLLLGFLARQKEQIKSVHFYLPPTDPIHLLVDDPRDAGLRMDNFLYSHGADICLGWMYRILNLKSAFECGRKFNQISGVLTVEIEDETLGDRSVTVHFDKGNVRASEENEACPRVISGTMDMFSQLFCGYMSAAQAYELDLLDFEGPDAVDFCQRAFSLPKPCCFDLF